MKKIIYAAMLLLGLSIIGCQKEESNTDTKTEPEPEQGKVENAKLTRVIYEYASGGHNVEDIKYDDKDRVIYLRGGEIFGYKDNISFSYDDNLHRVTLIVHDENDEVYDQIILQLNDNGLYEEDGYSYFNGHLISCGNWSYKWENDCLVSISHNGKGRDDFTYYSIDNPFYGRSFDPFIGNSAEFPVQYCFGFCGLGNKKLEKTDGGYYYEYSFNPEGRITEVLIYDDGNLYSHCYFTYEDETPREPRNEHTEAVPSDLVGDWVVTGFLNNISDREEIFTNFYMRYGAHVRFFSINQYSALTHIADYDENTLSYSNGILYGVDASSIDTRHEVDFVYKSGKIYNSDGTGRWLKPIDIEIISPDKFYFSQSDFPATYPDENTMYIFERVKEIKK